MNECNLRQRTARSTIICVEIGVLLIGISATEIMPKRLIWNASASLPIGLYTNAKDHLERGDLILTKLPDRVRLIANQRGYLPANVPALKRVAALSGDQVCRLDQTILINGKAVAQAKGMDRVAFTLPVWSGCVALDETDVFLLADHPNSFDGRYFGVTELANILGVVEPIWVKSK